VIEQTLSIAEGLIGPTEKTRPANVACDFPHDAEAEARIEAGIADLGICDFAIMNPGAGWGAKQWPAHRYGEVAQKLAERGVRSILNFGPGEESLAQEVESSSRGTAVRMSCTISELIALTRRASLFIGGDTGPMHLAAALRVPVVALFGPTDPARNGPYGTRSVVLRSQESVTSYARKAAPDAGLEAITSNSVTEAALRLLDQN
jgi:heptosyltransferase-1